MISGPEKITSTTKLLDPVKDKEVFEKARNILARGAPQSNRLQIEKLERTNEGYYRAQYSEIPRWMTENSSPQRRRALLDLEFPFAKEDMTTVVNRYRNQPNAELFLSFGPGGIDYPKKDNHDPRESTRVFFLVDEAFGRVRDQDKKREGPLFYIDHYVSSSNLMYEQPEKTYLFNDLPFKAMQNTFDVMQAANVISEPAGFSDPPDMIESLASLIKPGTGEPLLFNDYTPDVYPLKRVKKEVTRLGYTLEVVFDIPESKDDSKRRKLKETLPSELIQRLISEYHISPVHFENNDGYAVIIRKLGKSESS